MDGKLARFADDPTMRQFLDHFLGIENNNVEDATALQQARNEWTKYVQNEMNMSLACDICGKSPDTEVGRVNEGWFQWVDPSPKLACVESADLSWSSCLLLHCVLLRISQGSPVKFGDQNPNLKLEATFVQPVRQYRVAGSPKLLQRIIYVLLR